MELLARERQLEEQIKNLKEQLRAVRVMLAASASGTSAPVLPAPGAATIPEPAPHAVEPPPVVVPAPLPPGPPSVSAVPAEPPVPDDYRVKKSRKRGWFMERIEQLIDEGGPTFSFHTILDAYRAKWGWNRYPSRGTIGGTIWKVVRKRGHPVLQGGSGRRSTVYQKEIPK